MNRYVEELYEIADYLAGYYPDWARQVNDGADEILNLQSRLEASEKYAEERHNTVLSMLKANMQMVLKVDKAMAECNKANELLREVRDSVLISRDRLAKKIDDHLKGGAIEREWVGPVDGYVDDALQRLEYERDVWRSKAEERGKEACELRRRLDAPQYQEVQRAHDLAWQMQDERDAALDEVRDLTIELERARKGKQ